MQTVTELLGEAKRKVLYIVYGVLGVVLGATQTGFASAEVDAPMWLTVAFSVYMYVGVAFGLVAAQNVGAREVSPAEVDALEAPIVIVEDLDVEDLGNHGVVPTE